MTITIEQKIEELKALKADTENKLSELYKKKLVEKYGIDVGDLITVACPYYKNLRNKVCKVVGFDVSKDSAYYSIAVCNKDGGWGERYLRFHILHTTVVTKQGEQNGAQ